MKKTIIIVCIAVFAIFAICLGVLIAVFPDTVDQVVVDLHTPNSLIDTLDIERPDTKVDRLIAIKTYQDELSFKENAVIDLLKMAQNSGVEYYELNENTNDYLLVVPFEINGTMTVSTVKYDTYNEEYVEDSVIYKCNSGDKLPDNYALILRYSRPSEPEYQIQLVEEKDGILQTATYMITNTDDGKPVTVLQLVKDDINPGTDRVGNVEIDIDTGSEE